MANQIKNYMHNGVVDVTGEAKGALRTRILDPTKRIVSNAVVATAKEQLQKRLPGGAEADAFRNVYKGLVGAGSIAQAKLERVAAETRSKVEAASKAGVAAARIVKDRSLSAVAADAARAHARADLLERAVGMLAARVAQLMLVVQDFTGESISNGENQVSSSASIAGMADTNRNVDMSNISSSEV